MVSSSSPRHQRQREEEPENIDSVERLEKHNASYVGQSTDGYKNDRFGPDEIDVLVEALRIDKEEKERSEKCYFRVCCASPSSSSDAFSFAESFLDNVPHLFTTKILTKLDDQDRVVLSRCSKRMRAFVKNEFGETKYTKLCVRKFASSKEGIEYAKLCGVPKTERTFASIARIGNVEALGFALDSDWPHDVKAATACARGNHFETLRWMRANGLKWDKKEVLFAAMENRNVEMAEWIMMQEGEEEEEDDDDDDNK